jgi:hypothetical protein
MRDKSATLKWQLQNELSDSVTATFVSVNVATTDTTEQTEESPGTFIPINSTKNATITYAPGNLDIGELELSGGSGKLEFYDGTTKLTNTKWNLANTIGTNPSVTVPGTITLKGIDHGEVQYLTLTHDKSNAEDKLKVTVYELILEAPGKMVEMSPGVFHVPVLLNDNDNYGQNYTANWNCTVNCPDGCTADHRELEPVWDMNYIGSYSEPDLVQLKLEMKPNTMPGSVTLKTTSGASNIRLWQNANKGSKSAIITIPKTYNIPNLPVDFYAEGIVTGDVTFEAQYNPPQNINVNATKTLNAHVVSLVERQGGVRKIINANATPINFTVEGGSAFNSKIAWTVPSHNNSASLGTNNAVSVTYGATGCDVTLPENAANRRFTTTVGVSIDGKLTMQRNIRVAQATYQGTAVATTTPARRTEVAGLTAPPAGFNNTEPSGQYSQAWFETNYTGSSTPGDPVTTINNGRLQYAPNVSGDYGQTPYTGMGSNRKVYGVFILPDAYSAGLKLEDIQAIAEHECQHARQHIAVKTGGNNWRIVDDNFSQAVSYRVFREADAYITNLNSQGSWKYIDTRFYPFRNLNYNPAEQMCTIEGATTVGQAMKEILQSIYQSIPFEEMKKHDYEWYTRPPR